MIAWAAVSLASGIVGARMGSRRNCGAFRAFLWGLLFPVVGLVRPLLSRRLPDKNMAQSPLTRAQVDDLIKDSVRDARENDRLRAQVKELQERLSRLEGTAAGVQTVPTIRQAAVSDMSRAAQLAAEKRYSEKAPARAEPAREKTPKEHPEITHGRGMRR